MPQKTPEVVAAVDLGSNSFHMIVCKLNDGKLTTIDRLREMVRLASGLDKKKYLNLETQQRALACLERFGQRVRNFPPGSVRAVGTNTLRTAKNSRQFLIQAEAALGQPIHVIAGIEEARLIYQGVAHSLESNANTRFVMDIGGGSTEYIIGKDANPLRKESLRMGCVSVSNAFFSNGKINKKRFQQAVLHAKQLLGPFQKGFHKTNWDEAIGASGTLRTVHKVVHAAGWSNEGITLEGLDKLVQQMLSCKNVNNLELPELDPERAPVFPGGVAIIYATFQSLGIQKMAVSDGALREGLIYDLVGRIFNNDIRSETILTLAERYHVDKRHASRIKQTIRYILDQLNFSCPIRPADISQLLNWAAELHEIGHDIAHSQYHKHSAYILENADLAGFSQHDQKLLSTIVKSHRRRFPKKLYKELPAPWNNCLQHLAIILRFAILLHRNRQDHELPEYQVSIDQNNIKITFPKQWLTQAPLTNADLIQEAAYLKAAGFVMEFS